MKRPAFTLKTLLSGLGALALSTGALADGHVKELLWEREGADFSGYQKVYLRPLNLDDVKVLKPAWEQDNDDVWSFEGGAGQAVQDMFAAAMADELGGDNGFMLVSEGGPGVVQVEVEFLSLTPYVKPGTRTDSDYEIMTLGSGDVHLSAEIRDGETGEVLTLIEGERQIGTEYKKLSPENHAENLESTFRTWGQRLREYLLVKKAG